MHTCVPPGPDVKPRSRFCSLGDQRGWTPPRSASLSAAGDGALQAGGRGGQQPAGVADCQQEDRRSTGGQEKDRRRTGGGRRGGFTVEAGELLTSCVKCEKTQRLLFGSSCSLNEARGVRGRGLISGGAFTKCMLTLSSL